MLLLLEPRSALTVFFVCYIDLGLQCGIINIIIFWLFEPCGVTYVEVFGAPVVGTVGVLLIIFAGRVQDSFLRHEFLASLSVAQLGKVKRWRQAVVTRLFQFVYSTFMALIPGILSPQRTVLDMQTALALLQGEVGQGKVVYVSADWSCNVCDCSVPPSPSVVNVWCSAGETHPRSRRQRKTTLGGTDRESFPTA